MIISKKPKSFMILTCILSILLSINFVALTAISCSDDKKGPGPGELNAGPGEINAGPGEINAGPGEIDAGPGESDLKKISGSGNIKEYEIDIREFNKVEVSGEGVLIIEQGDAVSLVIETDDNLLEYVQASVSANKLKIKNKVDEGYDLVPTDSIYYHLKVKDLEELLLPGILTVECYNLQTSSLILDMSGITDIELSGKINNLNITVNGIGELKGGDFLSTVCSISGTGRADIVINVSEKLDINFPGIGSIKYIGDPEINMNVGKLVDVERID